MLTVEGLQLPAIPLVEVLGSTGTDPPEQTVSEVPKMNVGVILGLTTTFLVIEMAHCPGVGVNV